MALAVVLRRNTGGAVEYNLQANTVSIKYDRSALIVPLPGATDPRLIDLGQFKVSISIEGIVPVTGHSLVSATSPSKENLEDVLIGSGWFNQTIFIDVPRDPIATTPTRDRYTVKIINCHFEMKGAAEDRWNFSLTAVGFRSATAV